MKYFDTFTGVGAGSLAIQSVIPNAECVGFSEVDKYAEAVYKYHFPTHKNFGDITQIDVNNLPDFDLLIGGSPCQDLSIAKKKRKGLEGNKSSLFFKFLEILNTKKPKYFILENVASMSKLDKEKMTSYLGVEPICINSALLSAQNRKRLYWVGVLEEGKYKTAPIKQPEHTEVYLKDILENGFTERIKSLCIDANYANGIEIERYFDKSKRQLIFLGGIDSKKWIEDGKTYSRNFPQGMRIYSSEGKSVTLSTNGGGIGAKTGIYAIALRNRGKGKQPEIGGGKANALTTVQTDSLVLDDIIMRKLTPIECERLQTFPDNWTRYGIFNEDIKEISNTQRYKQMGNSFTVEVIKYILVNIMN